jgi:hypothetical protein
VSARDELISLFPRIISSAEQALKHASDRNTCVELQLIIALAEQAVDLAEVLAQATGASNPR